MRSCKCFVQKCSQDKWEHVNHVQPLYSNIILLLIGCQLHELRIATASPLILPCKQYHATIYRNYVTWGITINSASVFLFIACHVNITHIYTQTFCFRTQLLPLMLQTNTILTFEIKLNSSFTLVCTFRNAFNKK